MNVIQLKLGSPALLGSGYLPLHEAAAASGLDVDSLLRHAIQNRLRIYFDPGYIQGVMVPLKDLERDFDELGGGMVVPTPTTMPESAEPNSRPGILIIHPDDAHGYGSELLAGRDVEVHLFALPGKPGTGFAPTNAARLTRETVSVSITEVEQLRRVLASSITPAQLADAQTARLTTVANAKATRKTSEALDAFMLERSKSCSDDQARRIRAACELFVEFEGNPRLCDIDRDQIRRFRDQKLPSVPANENKVRLQYGTSKVSESIVAIRGGDWPRISASECNKRMQWLCGMFEWLHLEKWLADDPAVGLGTQPTARGKKSTSSHAKRDLFTRAELTSIFGASWFATGRGQITRAGTYREFTPLYYWLPLLGLFTGARINELCQLALTDIRKTAAGVWFIDINEDDREDKKKVKNDNSRRQIPIHPKLIELGLIKWRDELQKEGFDRLFPELTYDPVKGYSKAAVKWFSRYLAGLGWVRDGRKVFHSFRHTLSSECLNALQLTEAITAQISGHARSQSILGTTYRKDIVPDELVATVERLNFNIPTIAVFDIAAGLEAVRDAGKRKRRGNGPA